MSSLYVEKQRACTVQERLGSLVSVKWAVHVEIRVEVSGANPACMSPSHHNHCEEVTNVADSK